MLQPPEPSKHGQALATTYVDGERIRRENGKNDRVVWGRDEHMDLYAAELLELHAGSLELEVQGDELQVGARSANGLVQHIGQGVFVEHNTMGIDTDSDYNSKTITRKGTRAVACPGRH